MRSASLMTQLLCCLGLICIFNGCHPERTVAAADTTGTIRYGDNGVPIAVKGSDLSAPYDADPEFQILKVEKRYADIAFYYLDRMRATFKLTSAHDEFLVTDIQIDTLGQKHIRLEQIFNTIPVWGKDLRVHLNKKNQVYYVHGVYQPIAADLKTRAEISREAAAEKALRSMPDPDQWHVVKIDTCIWAPDNALQRLSYKVKMASKLDSQACFVDAIDGNVFHCISETMTLTPKSNKK